MSEAEPGIGPEYEPVDRQEMAALRAVEKYEPSQLPNKNPTAPDPEKQHDSGPDANLSGLDT